MSGLDRFTVYVMECQRGKTFLMLGQICDGVVQDVLREIDGERECRQLFVVSTMNLVTQNAQTRARFEKSLVEKTVARVKDERSHIEESVIREIVGASPVVSLATSGDVQNLDQLRARFTKIPTRVVLACTNTTRLSDFTSLMKSVNEGYIPRTKSMTFFFDEIHLYISRLRMYIGKLHECACVSRIIGFTATPIRVFGREAEWESFAITVPPPPGEVYVTLRDHDWHDKASGGANGVAEVVSYVHEALLGFFPGRLPPRSRWFVPGCAMTASHSGIEDVFFHHDPAGVVSVTMNCKGITIAWNDGDERKQDVATERHGEPSEVIADMIIKNGLDDRSVVFTGYNCVGTGQTLCSRRLGSFTHAIFSHTWLSPDNAYQLAGRTCGTVPAGADARPKTFVIAPRMFREMAFVMEDFVTRLRQRVAGAVLAREEAIDAVKAPDERGDVVDEGVRAQIACEMRRIVSPPLKTGEIEVGYRFFAEGETKEALDWAKEAATKYGIEEFAPEHKPRRMTDPETGRFATRLGCNAEKQVATKEALENFVEQHLKNPHVSAFANGVLTEARKKCFAFQRWDGYDGEVPIFLAAWVAVIVPK